MVTSPAARFGAGLLALFWCATLFLRLVVSTCPMGSLHAIPAHGEAAHALVEGAAPAAEATAHAATDGSHAVAVAEDAAPSTPTHDAPHPCDCLSHCCATTIGRPSDPTTTLVAMVVHSTTERTTVPVCVAADRSHVVLPFATAPPGTELG